MLESKLTLICFLLQSIIIIEIANVNCEGQPLESHLPQRSSSRLHRSVMIANKGLEFAKKCSLTSVRIKGAIIVGRA